MLKLQNTIFPHNGNPEPRVIHHPQNRPVHIAWLNSQGFVHRANKDGRAIFELGDGNVQGPETPAETCFAPVHVDFAAEEVAFEVAVFVFGVFDVC